MIRNYFYVFFVTLVTINLTFAQNNEYQQLPDYIKTVILKSKSANTYHPIIKLGERLFFSFDDLQADEKDYYYKIEHYNYDWEKSDLNETEFINGFSEDRIRDYENSFNTLQPYTHYRLEIPNKNTQIKISGNYVLSIFDDDEQLIFSKRFIVYQPNVDVGVTVHRSRDIATISEKQSVEFIINHPNLLINNPKEEIKTVVLQNFNWQNAIYNLTPQYFVGNQLLYKYIAETSFWGGNEFLYFDSKSIRVGSVNIRSVILGDDVYEYFLYTDDERANLPYTLNPDINGNFVVRTLDSENSFLDADYTLIHFTLNTQEYLDNKEIYIHGSFNDWALTDANKLIYNETNGLYEASLLLKQGFYNYQYTTKDKNNQLSNTDINGTFYQTENDYFVIVYYRKFGSRYDSVIGFGTGNSEQIHN